MNQKNKNGKIELLRFLFCIVILLFHTGEHLLYKNNIVFSDRFDFTFFTHGMIGVEFFFIVSGFLMAKEVDKRRKIQTAPLTVNILYKDWIDYLKRKIMTVFPQHTVAFILAFVCASLFRKYGIIDMIRCAISSIPQFFLIQMTGVKLNDIYPNNVEWYISAMLVAIALIYPLMRKYYEKFSKFFAPIIALFVLGYLTNTLGYISATVFWHKFYVIGTLRAIGMMCAGIWAYSVSSWLVRQNFKNKTKIVLLIIEVLTLILTLLYVVSDLTKSYEAIVAILIFILVTIAFSEQSAFSQKFNNNFFVFLGKISLPIYLSHLPAINFVKAFFMDERFIIKLAITLIITAIFTLITYNIGKILNKKFFSKINGIKKTL